MSSISSNPDHPVRVGRDPGVAGAFTRASVAIGFGSPSGDSGLTRLDLNDILVRHPLATFMMRIAGGAMRERGIDDGDLVLVDRAIPAAHGHIVIAVVEDEFVCRQLSKQGASMRLQAAGGNSPDVVAREGEDAQFELWGVVTQVIKAMPA